MTQQEAQQIAAQASQEFLASITGFLTTKGMEMAANLALARAQVEELQAEQASRDAAIEPAPK